MAGSRILVLAAYSAHGKTRFAFLKILILRQGLGLNSVNRSLIFSSLNVAVVKQMGAHLQVLGRQGFTLIELSIVLVVIGLIVGGVLAGRTLIRQSELMSVMTDTSNFDRAVYTFQSKYGPGIVPGDWGEAAAVLGQANCWAGVALTNGTCVDSQPDGSAVPDDGKLTYNDGGGDPIAEPALFWQQLSFLGLIPGSYAGLTASALGVGGHYDAVGGVNTPVSKIPGVIIGIAYMDAPSFSLWPIPNPNPGNYYLFGSSINNARAANSSMTGSEARALDLKMDDGLPLTGTMLAQPNVCCTAGNWSCIDFNNSVYQPGNSSCALLIRSGPAN